jgi:3-deoxy-D-manno-octulosonic-acid transferase
VAGSSWPKDEDILLEHFNQHPEMKLIIAPHEIHEEHIQGIIAKLKRPYMRYTQLVESKVRSIDCLIIDAIGFLSSIYRYGNVAYIGGGFGVGIHNTLEAAVYGMPVIFGPNHTAFREALGLLDAKGGFTISNAAEYAAIMQTFMTDANALAEAGRRAGEYVQAESGATDTIFKAVFG